MKITAIAALIGATTVTLLASNMNKQSHCATGSQSKSAECAECSCATEDKSNLTQITQPTESKQMPTHIETKQAFEALIQQDDKIVAVDFWAPWCGPCKAFAPILDQAAASLGSSGEIAKVNVDDLNDIANDYGISSIPTIVYFRNGKEVHRATGIEPEETILEHFKNLSEQPQTQM